MFEPAGRKDWFTWRDPPVDWCRAHAEIPGLQWDGDGQRVTAVRLHRSHLALFGYDPVHGFLGDGADSVSARAIEAQLAARGIVLRPYQSTDLPFVRARRGALLGYQQRLGKTLLAAAAHDPADGPLVVVGPLASREVWRDWITRVQGAPPAILKGRRVDLVAFGDHPAYFVHYDVFEAWTELFARLYKIGTLVLDECHLLQNRRARRTVAMNVLAVRASRIMGLSGTPMWDNPESLHSILHLLMPGAWGDHFTFCKRYTLATPGAHGWTYDGIANRDELRARLDQIMVRRTWIDVAPDLPPTTRTIEPVGITPAEQARLEALAVEAALVAGTTTAAGYLATLRRKLAEVKIKSAIEAARRDLADGRKTVVWTWHRMIGDTIARHLGGEAIRLRAEDSADLRDAKIAGFRASPTPLALVIGIAVGGTALDLSCADRAIYAELDWNAVTMQQSEMRTFHPSRPQAVTVLIADVPVEMRLIEVLGAREGFGQALGLSEAQIARMVLGTGQKIVYG